MQSGGIDPRDKTIISWGTNYKYNYRCKENRAGRKAKSRARVKVATRKRIDR